MSVQTGGSEWQCPGAGSQCRLSGCQERGSGEEGARGRGSSQPGGAACRQAGWWRKGGRVSGFVSYCQPKLVFREQKCQLIWHVFCLPVFPNTHLKLHSRSSPCNSLENAKAWAHRHTEVIRSIKAAALFNLMLHSIATLGICVWVVELSEMERVHTFVSLTFPPSSSGYGSSQSSWRADLSADGVDCTLRLKPEGPYLLRTQKHASYLPVHKLARAFPLAQYHILPYVSDSN